MSPCRARAAAIVATASPTGTSHGRPVPSAHGGFGTGWVAATIYCAVRWRSLSNTPRIACSVTESGDITVSPKPTM
ncbi:pyridoxamine 5'-phosphate oxidase family protein [Mycobacterium sp.]|uniref:pyridoxamine 5'-phosphate oxidase family protein n=1 Tax=Mycobacterium sp. TaxID=1785 RepID=UPI003C725BC1